MELGQPSWLSSIALQARSSGGLCRVLVYALNDSSSRYLQSDIILGRLILSRNVVIEHIDDTFYYIEVNGIPFL